MLEATKLTLEVKNLDSPDERRSLGHGVLDVVNLPGATIARAAFEPGWRWPTDVQPLVGTDSCQASPYGLHRLRPLPRPHGRRPRLRLRSPGTPMSSVPVTTPGSSATSPA